LQVNSHSGDRKNGAGRPSWNKKTISLPGIVDIQITAVPGQIITPPPEGASYLGFIFSRGATPQQAEAALRQAHALLSFDIQPDIPVTPE